MRHNSYTFFRHFLSCKGIFKLSDLKSFYSKVQCLSFLTSSTDCFCSCGWAVLFYFFACVIFCCCWKLNFLNNIMYNSGNQILPPLRNLLLLLFFCYFSRGCLLMIFLSSFIKPILFAMCGHWTFCSIKLLFH